MKRPNDKAQLLASICFNIVSKAPSLLSIFVVLPLISTNLGTSIYGEFLAMLALGAAFALPFGGINTVGRRKLSSAHACGDKELESKIVCDVIISSFAVTLLVGAIVEVIAIRTATTSQLAAVALLPVVAAFFNTFDNIRAAYNEHYVTAILQTISQFSIYSLVIALPLPNNATLISAMALQLPFIVASALTFAFLLVQKPELRQVHMPTGIQEIFKSAGYVALSDGAVFAAMNASVFGLGAVGATDISAWYGTLTRAFQTLLSPVLLIMLPLTSFVALKWQSWDSLRRRKMLNINFAVSGLYGAAVAAFFLAGGGFYLDLFPAIPRFGRIELFPLALFFGAIVSQKIYGQVIFSIWDGRLFSYGVSLAVLFGLLTSTLAYVWSQSAMTAICSMAGFTAVFVALAICWDQVHRSKGQP